MSRARNYAKEIRDQITRALESEDEFVPGVVAAKLVARLREKDPELLSGWLDEGAEGFIKEAINATERSYRTHARMTVRRSVFHAAGTAKEKGDSAPITSFLSTTYSLGDGQRKPLGSMTAEDLKFAASTYERQITQMKMAGTFLRVLSEQVGDGVVRDKFSEQRLAEMWRSLVR